MRPILKKLLVLNQVSGGGGVALDADAATLIAAMSSPPDSTRQTLINTTILSLKSAGIWALLDECWFMAAHDSQAARLGWKRYKDLSAVNGPTFATDRGYTGDGASSYLNTGFVPSTDGVKYAQDSASLGVYSRTDAQGTTTDIGARHTSNTRQARLQIRNSSNLITPLVNEDLNFTLANTSSAGLFAARRSGASASAVFRNGVSLGTGSATSVARPAFALSVGALNTAGTLSGYSTRQLAFAFVGASLSDQQMTDLFTTVEAYMDAIGAGVI
jgi:hypothetical protein